MIYKVKTTKLLVLDFWDLYYKFPLEALYLSSFLLIFGIMSIKTGAVSCQKEKRSKMEDCSGSDRATYSTCQSIFVYVLESAD